MWFHFCAANHNPIGRQTLGDMFDWLQAGLLDAGHRVTWHDTRAERGAINLLWDNFTPAWRNELVRSGITYGVIATEIPDDAGGFNWRPELEWRQRFASFGEVASEASFIWTMVESTAPFCEHFAPTAYMELGYSDRLLPKAKQPEPDIDFSFFGLSTPYREEVAVELSRHSDFVWPRSFLSAEQVLHLIGRTRVNLSFLQSPRWPVISGPRVGRAVLASRGVASERTPELTRQAQMIPVCPDCMPFIDFARDRLPGWRKEAERNLDCYREKLPMREIIERVLDVTIAGRNLSPAANGPVAFSFPPPKAPHLSRFRHWRQSRKLNRVLRLFRAS
jgi:hypothetical protein